MTPTIPAGRPPLQLVTESRLFLPFYSPQDMLNLGVYGGAYYGASNALSVLSKMSKSIANDLFLGVSPTQYSGDSYNQAINYFNVELPFTDRSFGMPPKLKRNHLYGWFEWYCQYYYGQKSMADEWRIRQWQNDINVHWYYISSNPARLTDLSYLPSRRQRLLERGWDPTINPAYYKLQVKF